VSTLEKKLETLKGLKHSREMAAARNPSWKQLCVPNQPVLAAVAPYTGAGCRAPALLSASTASQDPVLGVLLNGSTISPNFFSVVEDSRAIYEEDKAVLRSAATIVEVKYIGKFSQVTISTQWRRNQLAQVILAVESLCLNIIHINVQTIDRTAFYILLVKVTCPIACLCVLTLN
jgi:hypothetical protein